MGKGEVKDLRLWPASAADLVVMLHNFLRDVNLYNHCDV